MKKYLTPIILLAIILFALVIRFYYFPNNIYFGFDQARDAFAALDIMKGNLMVVGPPASYSGLTHGVLYYYLIAPIYNLFNGNPVALAFFLRVLNTLGVIFIFYTGKMLFNSKTGLIAAFLFAISFEESQFALYMGNPSPAVITILLMYLGLAMVFFGKKKIGLPLAFLGLGFSIQLEFSLFYLFIPFFLILILFKDSILKLPFKYYVLSFLSLIFSVATFIIAEIKFNFRIIRSLLAIPHVGGEGGFNGAIKPYLETIVKMTKYNLTGDLPAAEIILVIILSVFIFLIFKKHQLIKQFLFLLIWFFSLFSVFVIMGSNLNLQKGASMYYNYLGVSLGLLLLVSYLIEKISSKFFLFAVLILLYFLVGNILLINKINPKGTMTDINVQQDMMLKDEKQIIDEIYQQTKGEQFVVKAITMPFLINTTWSYLFEWYGQQKYGYLPVWGGQAAFGYPGNLKIEKAQSNLPKLQYLIQEPSRGIRLELITDYLKEEGFFTKVAWEKEIGKFILQKREAY